MHTQTKKNVRYPTVIWILQCGLTSESASKVKVRVVETNIMAGRKWEPNLNTTLANQHWKGSGKIASNIINGIIVRVVVGKSDLKSAFHILRLSQESWKWLIMQAKDPKSGIWYFFVDKCLPFGSSISCSHFQRFSNALHHLIENRTNSQGTITNYLDDFLFLALTVWRCNHLIHCFLEMCQDFGVPVSLEKTEFASEIVIFLGILMDG